MFSTSTALINCCGIYNLGLYYGFERFHLPQRPHQTNACQPDSKSCPTIPFNRVTVKIRKHTFMSVWTKLHHSQIGAYAFCLWNSVDLNLKHHFTSCVLRSFLLLLFFLIYINGEQPSLLIWRRLEPFGEHTILLSCQCELFYFVMFPSRWIHYWIFFWKINQACF